MFYILYSLIAFVSAAVALPLLECRYTPIYIDVVIEDCRQFWVTFNSAVNKPIVDCGQTPFWPHQIGLNGSNPLATLTNCSRA